MFNSNVQPRRTIKERLNDWYCQSCNREVRYYMKRCPDCGVRREH